MGSSQPASFPHTARLNTSPHTCVLGCPVLRNRSNKSLASELGLAEELTGAEGSILQTP